MIKTITLFTALALFIGAINIKDSDAKVTPFKTAILAGGCFWCVQSDFDKLKGNGVVSTLPGYTSGTIDNPTYDNYHDTGEGITPHVEAVKISYDPNRISYKEILEYYVHRIDVLDGEGQFCDRGAAYRPVIFTTNEDETKIAKEVLDEASKTLGKQTAVEILPASVFWPAEDYHQDYHDKNPVRYKYYRWNCGRDQRIKELWGKK